MYCIVTEEIEKEIEGLEKQHRQLTGAKARLVAEPSGRSEGTRAPFPRAVLHALTRKERDRA